MKEDVEPRLTESRERKIYGANLIDDAEERVVVIQANLKSVQSRQES